MSKARVMVVDDNPTNLRLAADVLELEGYEVVRAMDAGSAQALIRQSSPDIILMDIQMPGMDGLTLTRLLKSDATMERICIVAMTAFAMKGDEQKARDAGCDGYISKPIDTRRLAAHVAEFLRRYRGEEPTSNDRSQGDGDRFDDPKTCTGPRR